LVLWFTVAAKATPPCGNVADKAVVEKTMSCLYIVMLQQVVTAEV